jgi:hypothetical protein
MIDGRRVIMTTFAGRRDRMALLLRGVRAAMAAGVIDEWHVWDFARTREDRAWLTLEFPSLAHLPDKLAYRPVGMFDADAAGARRFEMGVRAGSDLHIRLACGQSMDYEIVLGGWGNARSALRVFDAGEAAGREVLNIATPGLLARRVTKTLVLTHEDGALLVTLNGRAVFRHAVALGEGPVAVHACTGFGSDGELFLPGRGDRREFLFAAKHEGAHPFGEFYQYYADRIDDYQDAVFLKADDDILFIDQARLSDFIRYRIAEQKYFLLSANVINNGVCAYYQQQEGLIPRALMDLELPPGGFCGRLWSNSAWAAALHDFFLADPARFTAHQFASPVIEWDQRLSINFVAWLGRDFAEMGCRHEDDERALSVEIPARLGRVNAIYAPFFVSHLSFYAQDAGMDAAGIVAKYVRSFA